MNFQFDFQHFQKCNLTICFLVLSELLDWHMNWSLNDTKSSIWFHFSTWSLYRIAMLALIAHLWLPLKSHLPVKVFLQFKKNHWWAVLLSRTCHQVLCIVYRKFGFVLTSRKQDKIRQLAFDQKRDIAMFNVQGALFSIYFALPIKMNIASGSYLV